MNSSFAFASLAPTVLQTTPASEHAQPDRASSTTVRKLTATSIISPIRRGESSSISLHVQPPRTSESSWLGPIVDEVAPGSPREISLGYNNAVTWFSARNVSMARVPVRSDEIWELITDPDTLASLTPLVASIEASGSHWRWALDGIEGLGVKVEAVFTERMEFIGERRIVFTHDPPAGERERAGVEGTYDLEPAGTTATDLKIDLTLSVDLPLPSLSRGAVEAVLGSTMRRTGQRFASNLYEEVGLDPSPVAVTERRVPGAQ